MRSSSAQTAATVYEKTISQAVETGAKGAKVDGTLILDCFLLYAILLGKEESGVPLELPHHSERAHRLTTVLNERNRESADVGLRHWSHRCNDCFKTVTEEGTGARCECSYPSSQYAL